MTVLPKLERELLAAHERTAARRRHARAFRWLAARRGAGGWLAPAFAVAATVAIVALFLVALRHSTSADHSVTTNNPSVIVLDPSVPHPGARLSESVATLERRFTAALPSVRVSRVGSQVVLRGVTASNRSRALALTRTGHLAFFDWEASVVTPNGKTVASQLKSGEPAAVALSQGSTGAPGGQGSGGLPLYAAVRLASQQPAASPAGQQLYLFGAPGSTGCAWAANVLGRSVIPRQPCYLAGPAASFTALTRGLPPGQRRRGARPDRAGQCRGLAGRGRRTRTSSGVRQPSGTVLRPAQSAGAGRQRDRASARDQEPGGAAVSFSFTAAGRAAFHRVTAAVAHRGDVCQRSRRDPGAALRHGA